MRGISVAPYVVWCTFVGGIIGLVGFIFLILFYTLQAPTMIAQSQPAQPPLFGTLNDAGYIFVAALLLPFALALYQWTKSRALAWSLLELVIGVIGLVAMVVVQALLVSPIITIEQAGPRVTPPIGIQRQQDLRIQVQSQHGKTVASSFCFLAFK